MGSVRAGSIGALFLVTMGFSGRASAQDAAAFFRQNCASCHTIGGGRTTGPDLKGAHERRSRAWLERFILDPPGTIASGDATATKLQREARGVVMPRVAGVTPTVVGQLIDLMRAESALERSQFAGMASAQRPLTRADEALGRALFSGARRLEAGGPPCMSCHTVRGLGALGGGRLGPDLTGTYGKLGGQQALATWLASPPSLTMQPVFKGHPLTPDEALGLVAYLKSAGSRGGAAETSSVNFVLLGLVGSIFSLVLFDFTWRRRFRAVRRPLVTGGKR
ncbi:MAG: c-type cytochrome [Deltaproteobacteria bacterium]|nr:c-type cytochrome [Deltaproteobacteria bacterium]